MRLMGFVLFLVSDFVLFSSFIFAYLYLRNSIQPTGRRSSTATSCRGSTPRSRR